MTHDEIEIAVSYTSAPFADGPRDIAKPPNRIGFMSNLQESAFIYLLNFWLPQNGWMSPGSMVIVGRGRPVSTSQGQKPIHHQDHL